MMGPPATGRPAEIVRSTPTMRYRFAEFTLDTDRETLDGPQGAIALRRRAFALLVTLLDNAPALVTRDRILDSVWGHDALSPNVLPQTISEIRRALADSAQTPRLIETRHRRGYRMLVAVERLDADLPATADAAAPPAPEASSISDAPARTRRRGMPLALAAAVVLLGAVALAWWWRTPPTARPQPAEPASLAIVGGRGSAAGDWIADAGAELLTVALADSERLQLLRPDGRFDGEAREGDARWQYWMRDVLGADYALTGTWSQSPDGISFDYTLLHLADGRVAFAANARAADLAGVCREVASRVRSHFRLLDPAPTWLSGLPAEGAPRSAYYRGVAALARGEPGAALAELEPAATAGSERALLALANAYVRAGEMARARATFARVLSAKNPTLGVGERLRIEAGAALADDRPADAVVALRALHELAPQDSALAFALLDAQLRARTADAAAATLASLARLGAGEGEDPRWHLADARLAALRHDQGTREAAATRARDAARRFGRPALALEAALERSAAQRAQGQLAAARGELEKLLADEPPQPLLPDVQRELGSLLRDLGEFDAAQSMLEAARRGYAAFGRRSGELEASIDLHTVESERGRIEDAYARLLAMEPEVAALGDPALLARLHNTLGVQATRNNDAAAAASHLEQAATLARRANRPAQEAGALNNLGQMYARAKRNDEAQAMWERALEGFRDSGDRMGEAITLSNLGALAHRQGQAQRGNELNRRALEQLRELGASQHVARIAFNLGLQVEREGRLDEAATLFEEAYGAFRAGAGRDTALHPLAALARVRLALGEPAAAREVLDAAREAVAAAADPLARSLVETVRAQIEESGGDFAASRRHHETAHALRRDAKLEDWSWLSELALRRLDLLQGKPAQPARAAAERIAVRFERAADAKGELAARLLEAAVLVRLGREADALSGLERAGGLAAKVGDLGLSRELDRLRILAAQDPAATRALRLAALAQDARGSGYRLFAWRCELDAAAHTPDALAALSETVRHAGLAGLLHPLP